MVNKVIYGGNVLIDLTNDTVTEEKLFNGITAHDKSGRVITGTLFSGFPEKVVILKVEPLTSITKKEKNIVVFNKKTLIDLTMDTVMSDKLLWGYQCHQRDGSLINGTFLENYPDICVFANNILDSNGNSILDSNGNSILDRIIYKKSVSENNIIYTKI